MNRATCRDCTWDANNDDPQVLTELGISHNTSHEGHTVDYAWENQVTNPSETSVRLLPGSYPVSGSGWSSPGEGTINLGGFQRVAQVQAEPHYLDDTLIAIRAAMLMSELSHMDREILDELPAPVRDAMRRLSGALGDWS